MHPLHNVNPNFNHTHIDGIIEIPQGSRIKYEIDKKSGLIRMDRLLSSSFEYPVNYGFIPQTLGYDGDPLDILVITHSPLVPLCLVRCRILGVMQMIDRGIQDDKIIAAAETDVTQAHLQSMEDLPRHFFKELENFFEEYTKLENKKVDVLQFNDQKYAAQIIIEHINNYKSKPQSH